MSLALQICLPIITALISVAAGYGLNNFPVIQGMAGKRWALFRSTMWLTLMALVLGMLADGDADEALKRWAARLALVLGTALLYEAGNVASAVWRAKRGKADEELTEPQTLKEKLIGEVRYRVKERLDYAVGAKSLARVPMSQVPTALGREKRVDLAKRTEPEKQTDSEKRAELERREQAERKLFSLGRQVLQIFRREQVVPQEEEHSEEKAEAQAEELAVTDILWAFNHEVVDRRLLILGEPGAGKTTALLTLADALLEQTEGTGQFPYRVNLRSFPK